MSKDPPGRATVFRGHIEEGYGRQAVVCGVVAELGVPVDLDLVRYRQLRRWIVRERVRSARGELFGGLTAIAAFWVLAFLVADHFAPSETVFWALFGVLAFSLLSLPPWLVLQWVLQHFPRAGILASTLFLVVLETAAGLIVYGEVAGEGPVHAIAGNFRENLLLYAATQAVLLFSVLLTGYLLLAPIVMRSERRRQVRHNPVATAVNTLFQCIELACDPEQFRRPRTRYQLVTHTHEVARILQYGLWRTMPVRSPLAVAELKRRCLHAGQSVEILCAGLVLPEAATRERYLLKTIRLAETLLSGNLGDLPDDPDRAAYTIRNRIASAKRLAVKVAVASIPLAAALVQWRFHVFPASVDVPLLTVTGAWLATFVLTAAGRRYPDEISRFPDALTFLKGGK
ncbi:hypothetical protein [Amycolatopsis vancoresmycina]|uniref:hypothetical protein n=1 Tax=Amycolatopsis vancoresmycina TaxID=208444 RepID=UPI0012DE3137|nr:hypothetical protein [Amycolatopsis vancoresmycina]